jgi:hypothetical protein
VPQPDVETVRKHDKARADVLTVRQRDDLPVRAGRDRRGLGVNEFGAGRNFGPHGVDQRIVKDAVLVARSLLYDVAKACDPAFFIEGAGSEHGVGYAGAAQDADLRPIELLAA